MTRDRIQGILALTIATMSAVFAPCSPARAANEPLGRLWADLGVGYGSMRTSVSPVTGNAGGLWVDVQLGARISSRWLAGVDISGLGLHAGTANDDPNSYYKTTFGENISNVFLVFQYEPKSDHGWFLGAGAGEVRYNNKSLEDLTGNAYSGNGPGALARVGYDWPYAKRRGHFEAVLSYQVDAISLNEPLNGNFHNSILAVSFHVAYH
jgi:hypothetical protein